MSEATRRASEALEAALGNSRRLEWWGWLAHLAFAVFLGGFFYLGSRSGGENAIYVYQWGRLWIALAALCLIVVGVAWSLFRRPFHQRGRVRSLVMLTAIVGLANLPFPYPTPHEGHPPPVCFRLPVEGEWTVYWGGDDPERNRLANTSHDRRFGLDLILVREGAAASGPSKEDHFCFGEPALAPCAGVVVRAHDGEPDQEPRSWAGRGAPCGNHVVLEVSDGVFCFLTHLRQGSVRVAVGERVTAGTPLGEVGSSGISTVTPFPHLAVHLQDTPEPGAGEAIPWTFCDYLANGSPVARGVPWGGQTRAGVPSGARVRNAP